MEAFGDLGIPFRHRSCLKKLMLEPVGLAETLKVANGGSIQHLDEGEFKLLGFFLRDGECTAEISDSIISVWYSWLRRPLPSRYFLSLAPGLVGELMRLGNVERIADEATFQVGPGTTDTGRDARDFHRKWIRIRCEDTRIIIKVRGNYSAARNGKAGSFPVSL